MRFFSRASDTTVCVVLPDGGVRLYPDAVTVFDVSQDFPGCLVWPDHARCGSVLPLPPHVQLSPSETYCVRFASPGRVSDCEQKRARAAVTSSAPRGEDAARSRGGQVEASERSGGVSACRHRCASPPLSPALPSICAPPASNPSTLLKYNASALTPSLLSPRPSLSSASSPPSSPSPSLVLEVLRPHDGAASAAAAAATRSYPPVQLQSRSFVRRHTAPSTTHSSSSLGRVKSHNDLHAVGAAATGATAAPTFSACCRGRCGPSAALSAHSLGGNASQECGAAQYKEERRAVPHAEKICRACCKGDITFMVAGDGQSHGRARQMALSASSPCLSDASSTPSPITRRHSLTAPRQQASASPRNASSAADPWLLTSLANHVHCSAEPRNNSGTRRCSIDCSSVQLHGHHRNHQQHQQHHYKQHQQPWESQSSQLPAVGEQSGGWPQPHNAATRMGTCAAKGLGRSAGPSSPPCISPNPHPSSSSSMSLSGSSEPLQASAALLPAGRCCFSPHGVSVPPLATDGGRAAPRTRHPSPHGAMLTATAPALHTPSDHLASVPESGPATLSSPPLSTASTSMSSTPTPTLPCTTSLPFTNTSASPTPSAGGLSRNWVGQGSHAIPAARLSMAQRRSSSDRPSRCFRRSLDSPSHADSHAPGFYHVLFPNMPADIVVGRGPVGKASTCVGNQ